MSALVMIDRPCGGEGPGPAFRTVNPQSPQLTVTDLSVTRGDGVFEAVAVRGVVQAERRHLERFARSAAMLDLPAPDLDVYAAACRAAVAALPDATDAFARYVLSRGDDEEPNGPVGWVYAAPAPDHEVERVHGVSVMLADRGLSVHVPATAPWLLAGAKTLSYAVNKAVLREACRRGADDVLFYSTDGFLLEGPTASLVVRVGDTLLTPRPDNGVLPGTTQADLFDYAPTLGLRTQTRSMLLTELAEADAAWLVSSIRLAAPINAVDGQPWSVDRALTTQFNAHLTSRTQ